MSTGMDKLVNNILRDVRVELSDEFDRNFSLQGFFGSKWARRKSPSDPGRGILIGKGKTGLRKSISSRISGNTITFYSDLHYAAIHNDGGEIKVTQRMKNYFWRQYILARGSFELRKNGERRKNKRNAFINEQAEFFKSMALKKVGDVVKMPRRQFLGTHPKLEQAVREIIEENVEQALGGLAQGISLGIRD